MKITVVAMGNKMPAWVDQAVSEYSKRLQEAVSITLVEIPLIRRGKSADISRIMAKEMTMMNAAIPHQSYIIALEIKGESFTSEQLAKKIAALQHKTPQLCFLIGGPEGLSADLVARSDERWSLSSLTLPHALARITLLEALYRAWSILNNHPYHK